MVSSCINILASYTGRKAKRFVFKKTIVFSKLKNLTNPELQQFIHQMFVDICSVSSSAGDTKVKKAGRCSSGAPLLSVEGLRQRDGRRQNNILARLRGPQGKRRGPFNHSKIEMNWRNGGACRPGVILI